MVSHVRPDKHLRDFPSVTFALPESDRSPEPRGRTNAAQVRRQVSREDQRIRHEVCTERHGHRRDVKGEAKSGKGPLQLEVKFAKRCEEREKRGNRVLVD